MCTSPAMLNTNAGPLSSGASGDPASTRAGNSTATFGGRGVSGSGFSGQPESAINNQARGSVTRRIVQWKIDRRGLLFGLGKTHLVEPRFDAGGDRRVDGSLHLGAFHRPTVENGEAEQQLA